MVPIEYQSYHDIFERKMKQCKSKKDYKKLCKEMIFQFGVIDKVDENQYKVFSSLIGSDNYLRGMASAIKMYLLEQQGVSFDIISSETDFHDLDI